jgi:flagellar basal body-associated protein FliL
MNDPLRDNRIFPEEMHQQPIPPTKKESHMSWLMTLIVVIGFLILVWFGYNYYMKSQNTSSITEFKKDPVYQEQLANFNAVQQAAPKLSRKQREEKMQVFFGTTN